MNVVFVSHCDFEGNSAMHIFSIANELERLGIESIVCVPNNPETVASHGTPRFRVVHHDEALKSPLVFSDGRGPDLIHAWTPRELVRHVTETLSHRYAAPYFVHLEDNETTILEDDLGGVPVSLLTGLPLGLVDQLVPLHRTHPIRASTFLAGAAGITVLMDRLLEFKPAEVPGAVFWPGFDESFQEARRDPAYRRRLGLDEADTLVVYTGNVHQSNVGEARSLVAAVAALHRRGHHLTLAKTGWNFTDIPYFESGKRDGFIKDLGFCARSDIPRLVACADVLVQPGRAGDFNDYRFPSKLPEFLVSGIPVVLPRTNIGRFLHDDEECVLLDEGHALEIATRLEPLLEDGGRRRRIGAAGRRFAQRELTWSRSAKALMQFYDEVLETMSHTGAHGDGISAIGDSAPTPASPVTSAIPRLIAFYLPQFHRIKENDEWWGDGFTEWTNVKRATPSFDGHEQPLLPGDLGFYDLSQLDVMQRQADLARSFGIHGFCFYYYWFDGRRLLERPVDQMLASGTPDFPFCVCWANENWSRRWDGSEDEVLIRQDYSEGYAERFIRDVIPMFRDRRYIRVGGAPLLLVYRTDLLPDAAGAAAVWRRACADEGIPDIHLAAVQSFGIGDPRPFGFDAAVEFPPHVRRRLMDPATMRGLAADFDGYLEDYPAVARDQAMAALPPFVQYRGVMPAWDNTPRRLRRAHVCVGASPTEYEAWLRHIVTQAMTRRVAQEPLIFVNAWNEWAEGAFLEPDDCNGYSRLEATSRGLCRGMTDFFVREGIPVSEAMVMRALIAEGVIDADRGEA